MSDCPLNASAPTMPISTRLWTFCFILYAAICFHNMLTVEKISVTGWGLLGCLIVLMTVWYLWLCYRRRHLGGDSGAYLVIFLSVTAGLAWICFVEERGEWFGGLGVSALACLWNVHDLWHEPRRATA